MLRKGGELLARRFGVEGGFSILGAWLDMGDW